MERSLPESVPPIHVIRGQRVVLDADLASLYEVPTKAFNQTILRNTVRFPGDFAFRLVREEVANLRSQNVTSSSARSEDAPAFHGGRRYLPWVFTEHGAIMAATLLRSRRAVAMSVFVVRAFVRLREEVLDQAAIRETLARHGQHLLEHDAVLQEVVEHLRPLLNPPEEPPKRRIGFYPAQE
jgi:hypothetical protein